MTFIYRLAIWSTKAVAKLFFGFKVIHPQGFDETGPLLIAANHASYFDPPLVAISLRKDIHFLARNTLYSNGFARWLFPRLNVIPVDQEKAEVAPLKTVIRLLKENKRALIFPEGGRSKDGLLQPAQGGAGFIVAKTGSAVLPMRIFGAHEALPPGEKKIKRRKITVVVGPVIRFTPEELVGGKAAYQAISDRIMDEIAKLECPLDRLPKPR
jgi:1-acyl-sn-glycerol-3-phosphate acyltransferase